jgi:hypothetical protein
MTAVPYVGITGIVTDEDVDTIRALVPRCTGRRLMAGVLVSAKTLQGIPVSNRRYPRIRHANRLLEACAAAGAWPVVHFNTREPTPLSEQLEILVSELPAARGIQLNVVRPDPAEAEEFFCRRPQVEFIAQVNRGAGLTKYPYVAAEYVARYALSAAHALLDLSGGTGATLDPRWVAQVLRLWPTRAVRPALAGGLGPGTAGAAIRGVIRAINAGCLVPQTGSHLSFSVDAESRLRVPVEDPIVGARFQDRLDRARAEAYVDEAVSAFAEFERAA